MGVQNKKVEPDQGSVTAASALLSSRRLFEKVPTARAIVTDHSGSVSCLRKALLYLNTVPALNIVLVL
jgi:hypothetical protein